jgi:hypothetical protein
MHGSFGKSAIAATKGGGTFAVEITTSGRSAVDDENWFAEAAQELYGRNKPGTALFYATGLGDERGCQRYAAGTVKPPAYFFRRLLRSPDGWQWLCAAMDGCQESWWKDVRLAVAYELKRKEVECKIASTS